MDCRSFRNNHLCYLDDTLSGEQTAAAQRHVLSCDGCAAHDTLVRRSLMMARSLEPIQPSEEFQRRLRARLAACQQVAAASIDSPNSNESRSLMPRSSVYIAVVAAGVALGTLAWNGMAPEPAAVVASQPVVSPALTRPAGSQSYISPALMQAMSTGNPVWPAAIIIDDAPSQFIAADLRFIDEIR